MTLWFKKNILLLTIFAVTLILQPWRNSVSQDDGVYAKASVQFSENNFSVHPLNVAGVWPQTALGALTLKLVPSENPLMILNFLTWILFIALIFLVRHLTKFDDILLLSFFLFPVWLQYGASFLTDIYTGFILTLMMLLLSFKKEGLFHCLTLVALSCFLGLQYQSFLAFPFCWGLFLLLSNRKVALSLLLGCVLCFLFLHFLPSTPVQSGGLSARFLIRQQQGNQFFKEFTFAIFELGLALGLFLLPFVDLKKLRLRFLLAQLAIIIALEFSGAGILSAGVLFTGYLPHIVGVLFLSFGLWGQESFRQIVIAQKNKKYAVPFFGTLMAIFLILAFNAFRTVEDIRYSMILSLPLLLYISKNQKTFLGNRDWYLFLVLVVSLFANEYNLNTTEARWKGAQVLQNHGVSVHEISAGYGHDLFYLEPECANTALEKIKRTSSKDGEKELFLRRFFSVTPRVYEDEWVSRFLIKPYKIFGKTINLNKNRQKGQELSPSQILHYKVFGVDNEVAIINTGESHPPWCLQ